MRGRLRAFRTGLREWRSVVDAGIGRTYADPGASEAYDRGVNLGENAAAARRALAVLLRFARRPLAYQPPRD